MSSLETIHELMQEASNLLDVAEVTERIDDPSWCFILDEDTYVDVDYDEAADRLVLSISLGPVPRERQEEIFKLLLAYNMLWRETGGGRMALDPESNEAEFLVDLPAAKTDVSAFCAVFDHFVANAQDWRGIVQASSTEAPPLEDFGNALRV